MDNENTISDLISRIKLEGQLTRNSGTNSIKVLIGISSDIRDRMDAQLAVMTNNNNTFEDFLSDVARQQQFSGFGGDDSSSSNALPAPSRSSGRSEDGFSLPKLGLLSTLAASAIGGTIGVLQGWLNAIKFFTPTKIIQALEDVTSVIKGALTGFAEMGKGVIASAKTAIFGALGPLTQFKDFFLRLTEPFVNAVKAIQGVVVYAFDVTSKAEDMLSYFKMFGNAVSKIAGVVGKVFLPISIVMTAIDTVQGIISGYTEDGMIGALEGAVTGFFNSIIFGPLDLIKSMTSWVVGKLGFENAAETLDSFSFSELFSQFVSGIFDLGTGIINSLVESFTKIKNEFTTGDVMSGIGTLLKESFTTIVTKPLDFVKHIVSRLASMFGFENASAWLDSFSIAEIFNAVGDWISAIPGKIVDSIQDMWINTMEKFKMGFVGFSNWISSLPQRIYLNALEFLRSTKAGFLVTDSMLSDARAAGAGPRAGTTSALARIKIEARNQRAQLAAERVREEAARVESTRSVVAPVMTDNRTTVGPTNNVTNTTIVTAPSAASALSSYNQFQLNGLQ